MPAHVTYFDAAANSYATADARTPRGVLGAQLGSSEALAVGSAAVPGAVDATKPRLALIKTTEACRIDVVAGSNGAATAASGWWASGEIDLRFVPAGMRLSVIAA